MRFLSPFRCLVVVGATVALFLVWSQSGSKVFAQTDYCPTISLSPSTVRKGDPITVVFSRQLIEQEFARLSISGVPDQTVNCVDDPNLCHGGITNIFTIDTSNAAFVAGQTYTANVTYINGISQRWDCAKPFSITATQVNVCSPVGVQSVTPNPGSTTDNFTFVGCAGSFGAGQNAGVVITDPTQSNRSIREIPIIATTGDSTHPAGTFIVTATNFPVGILDAQLYLSQSATGGTVEFAVDQPATTCQEARACQVGSATGTQLCNGVRQHGVCQYDPETQCDECRYCGDHQCSSTESLTSCPQDCSTVRCGNGQCETGEGSDSCPQDCHDPNAPEPTPPPLDPFNFCKQVPENSSQHAACLQCVGGGGSQVSDHIYTAVGCVRTSNTGLAADLVGLMIGVSGGVALLSILAGAFTYATSQGDSNKLKQAKDLITSSVIGILFIIFSVMIFQFIGVKLLQIPGLS